MAPSQARPRRPWASERKLPRRSWHSLAGCGLHVLHSRWRTL